MHLGLQVRLSSSCRPASRCSRPAHRFQPKNVIEHPLQEHHATHRIAGICFWAFWAMVCRVRPDSAGGFMGKTGCALPDGHRQQRERRLGVLVLPVGVRRRSRRRSWPARWRSAPPVLARTSCTRSSCAATFIYPVVVHWGWGTGWLSAWGANPDAAGEARPLLTGTSASNGIDRLRRLGHRAHGRRRLRARGGHHRRWPAHAGASTRTRASAGRAATRATPSLNQALGTIILWFGWYGFNCGSTLRPVGRRSARWRAKVR